jgi:hypothetical protein
MRRGIGAAIAGALGCLALWVPVASATAPSNDDFADREPLSGLPIDVGASNVEATREDGEPFLLFGAGHTIWYEWEATSTGFVTVGTCGTPFDAEVGIYTGVAVNALTKVTDTSNGGPGCPASGRQATFRAVSGTTYAITVDGNGFYLPEWPKPVTEGAVALQIEATPPPPNDAFGSPDVLSGREEEEPMEPPFYFASTSGYNWGAGKQSGEPEHAGDPGGASVWFTWTAPATGSARLSVQGNGFDPLLAIYSGSALGALVPLASTAPFGLQVPVTAGTTYRIAVDGRRDTGTGEADVASFSLTLFMQLPLRGQPPTLPAPSLPVVDRTPPETTLAKQVLKRLPPILVFHFSSNEPGGSFRCQLDGKAFRVCAPPKSFGHLGPGRHRFSVKAIDAAGNEDPTPASTRFRIPERPPRLQR